MKSKSKPETTEAVQRIPLALIKPGDNDRTWFDPTGIQELANDIKANGQHTPIIVRPVSDKQRPYEIVAGERRFRACTAAGLITVAAIIRKLDDEQAAGIMLSENVHRTDLDPIDEAAAYRKRMDKFGWSVNQAADHARKNSKHVAARLLLLDCLPEMQDLVRRKMIPVSFGEIMAPLDTNRQRIALTYVTSTEKPLLREFKALCGRLLADQNQGALMDLSAIPTQEVIEQAKMEGAPKRWAEYQATKGRFPINDRIPELKRVGGIGESFEAYLDVLLESDDPTFREAAAVVGRVYDSMVRQGLCFPPHPNKKHKAQPTGTT